MYKNKILDISAIVIFILCMPIVLSFLSIMVIVGLALNKKYEILLLIILVGVAVATVKLQQGGWL